MNNIIDQNHRGIKRKIRGFYMVLEIMFIVLTTLLSMTGQPGMIAVGGIVSVGFLIIRKNHFDKK